MCRTTLIEIAIYSFCLTSFKIDFTSTEYSLMAIALYMFSCIIRSGSVDAGGIRPYQWREREHVAEETVVTHVLCLSAWRYFVQMHLTPLEIQPLGCTTHCTRLWQANNSYILASLLWCCINIPSKTRENSLLLLLPAVLHAVVLLVAEG